MEPQTSTEILQAAKEKFYSGENHDPMFEAAYKLGWLQSAYDTLLDKYNKKQSHVDLLR